MVRTFRSEMTVKTAMELASCLDPEAYPEGEPWREVARVLAKEMLRLRGLPREVCLVCDLEAKRMEEMKLCE